MSNKIYTNRTVYEASIDRIAKVMLEGHRLIFAFSGGKDSGVLVELAILAGKKTGCLPIEVMFRDDEILYPGTAEYAERIASRPEVNFHWIVNKQAATNIYNRELPFYWCFDDEIPRSSWVRSYPNTAEIDLVNIHLYYIVNPTKYAPPPGHKLVSVVGIRTEESKNRNFAIRSARGPRSNSPDDKRMFNFYPIYDWTATDIWTAIKKFGWDYNDAYEVLYKMGVPKNRQRMSQIAMSPIGAESLKIAAKAWPQWFDKVCARLPGIRSVAHYGERALRPIRKENETWETCFYRTCVDNAPEWIANRSMWAIDKIKTYHSKHSNLPFPDVQKCPVCKQSFYTMAWSLYSGDPFHIEITWLPDAEPSWFRKTETRMAVKSHKMKKRDREILEA